jgi:hypothetical protein
MILMQDARQRAASVFISKGDLFRERSKTVQSSGLFH